MSETIKVNKSADFREYVKQGGSKCPWCESMELDGSGFEFDANAVWQEVNCGDCKNRWIDIFTLTAVESVEGRVLSKAGDYER